MKIVDALDRLLLNQHMTQSTDDDNFIYDLTQAGPSAARIDALDRLFLGQRMGNTAP